VTVGTNQWARTCEPDPSTTFASELKGVSMTTYLVNLARTRIQRRAAIAVAVLAGLVGLAIDASAEASPVTKPALNAPRTQFPGFLLDRGRYVPIEHPRSVTQTVAFGINNWGQIVGGYDDAEGRSHGFLRDPRGRYRTIDAPGCYATALTRINDRGQITGDCWTTKERYEQGLKRGFLLERGRFVRVNVPGSDSTEAVGLDNRGRVVGETNTLEPLELHGYLWDDGRIRRIDVPGAFGTGAEEINERGQIAGTYFTDAVTSRGYLLDKGRFRTFAAPGGPLTQVFGLNNRGQIAGYVADDELLNDAHGFVLARGVGGPVTPIDVPGAPRTLVLGINDFGQIVGQYENPDATAATQRAGVQRMSFLPGLSRPGGK
jgi:probable HAF family extracellular repeat protein